MTDGDTYGYPSLYLQLSVLTVHIFLVSDNSLIFIHMNYVLFPFQ